MFGWWIICLHLIAKVGRVGWLNVSFCAVLSQNSTLNKGLVCYCI